MERIVIVISPTGVERTSLEFACFLANLTGSKLNGLFLHEAPLMEVAEKPGIHFCHHAKEAQVFPLISRNDIDAIKLDFDRFCSNHGLTWIPETKDAVNINHVILESRFADLLIINADTSFSTELEGIPTDTVTYTLKHAECPVIIAPLTFNEINEIVFTYDGTASSVFAIKQFTHQFPQFRNNKISFLEVNDDSSPGIQHKKMITEYLGTHYSSIDYQVLKGDPEDQLFSYFLTRKDVFIVMGAFGKKIIPTIFKRSTASLLLKTTCLPIFISHK
jgi:hypothetical protein